MREWQVMRFETEYHLGLLVFTKVLDNLIEGYLDNLVGITVIVTHYSEVAEGRIVS